MLAGVLHGPHDLRVEEVTAPAAPGRAEVLIEVRAVGLCGTDAAEWRAARQVPLQERHRWTGHVGPTVLGHEFSGVVVGTGAGVPESWLGQLVACCGTVSCGSCPACRAGLTSRCEEYWVVGLHRDGALSSHVVAPVASCFPVPGSLTPDEAALAQPMAVAVHAARRGRPREAGRAVVVGAGGIGACLVHVLVSWGVDVTVVDHDPGRLAVAGELGAGRLARSLSELADVRPPGLVYEVTGNRDVLAEALDVAALGARLVLVGMQKAPLTATLDRVTLREQELLGTNSLVAATDLPEAVRLLERRAGRWDLLAPRVIPLRDVVPDGLEPLATGTSSSIKILVDPTATSARALYPAS